MDSEQASYRERLKEVLGSSEDLDTFKYWSKDRDL